MSRTGKDIVTFSAKHIVRNYFLLMAINGLLLMLGISYLKLDILLALAVFLVFGDSIKRTLSFLDGFILFFILSISIISLSNNYPFELWYYGVRYQLFVTLFYFVGKSKYFADWTFFDRGTIIIVVVGIIGLFLLIYSPSWYMNWKLSLTTHELTDSFILEMTRLSAFWTYPYWISYGSAIIFIYLCYKAYFLRNISIMINITLAFLLIILFLSQQRAPLFISILSVVIINAISFFQGKLSVKSFLYTLTFVFVLFIGLFLAFDFVSGDYLDRFSTKFEEVLRPSGNSFFQSRNNVLKGFLSKGISFWGDGLGLYSHKAISLGLKYISDQQYYRFACETGYYGIIGYSLILVIVLLEGLKRWKYNVFELLIVLFYCISMLGANSLSVFDQHPAVFWLCCGRIFNSRCLAYKIIEEKESNIFSKK